MSGQNGGNRLDRIERMIAQRERASEEAHARHDREIAQIREIGRKTREDLRRWGVAAVKEALNQRKRRHELDVALKAVMGTLDGFGKRADQRFEEQTAANAEAALRTNETLKGLAESRKQTEAAVKDLAESHKQTEAAIKNLAESHKQTEAVVKGLAESSKQTDATLKALLESMGRGSGPT